MSKKINLYFQNHYGELRLINTCATVKEIYKEIYNFLEEHNYKSYYIRSWYKDGKTWFDVGSHTEFFACDGNVMEG